MSNRRYINVDPSGHIARFGLAIADTVRWPLERIAWALEERLVWRGAGLLRRTSDTLGWSLERLAWVAERRLVWPLQERVAGWSQPSRAAGAGALAAVGVGVVLLAVLSASGSGPGRQQAAAPARVVIASAPAAPSPAPAPAEPVLQGVAPSFGASESSGDAPAAGGAATESDSGSTAAGNADEAAAGASRAKPVPAGPVAMRVARRFAEAFVFYEIGERPARARTVFGETATPRLATALAERPPRLPEKARVPQARVLNLVPGPRRGKAYTVSVSLLRVGVTSELRLEMKKRDGAWLVTDVRG
jgi:hypothetical protein